MRIGKEVGAPIKPGDEGYRKWWQVNASRLKLHYLDEYAVGRTALDIGTGAGPYARALLERGFQVADLDL